MNKEMVYIFFIGISCGISLAGIILKIYLIFQ